MGWGFLQRRFIVVERVADVIYETHLSPFPHLQSYPIFFEVQFADRDHELTGGCGADLVSDFG